MGRGAFPCWVISPDSHGGVSRAVGDPSPKALLRAVSKDLGASEDPCLRHFRGSTREQKHEWSQWGTRKQRIINSDPKKVWSSKEDDNSQGVRDGGTESQEDPF